MLDRIWETRDGTRILVSDMTTDHINRCIASIECERYGKRWRREYLARLPLELVIRAIEGRNPAIE